MDYTTNTVDLSLVNANTGNMLTANVYNVQFDDGSSRVMSIGQLVMAICLERANEKEASIIDIMDEMAGVTENISVLSDIAQKLVDLDSQGNITDVTGTWTISYTNSEGEYVTETYTDRAQQVLSLLGVSVTTATSIDTCLSSVQSKLDELNTQSQEQLITLQSETNKRDQSYEMISTMLKSMYTVMSGVVNNV